MSGVSASTATPTTHEYFALSRQLSMLGEWRDAAGVVDNPQRKDEPRDVKSARILVIDDEPINAKVACRYLRDAGYMNCIATHDSRKALELIRQEKPDLVLMDLMMPGMDGLQLLAKIRQDAEFRQTPVIVLTVIDDRGTKLAALELGTNDFLTKPVDPIDLLPRIRNVLAAKAYQDHLANYARELEQQVRQRTEELEASRLEVIYCLGRAAEYRDNETGKHVIRVGRYVGIIAHALGLDDGMVRLLEHAAPLHDMGKIGIPDSVLLKPGRLDEQEVEIMRRHTEYGCDIVTTINREEWRKNTSPASGSTDLLQPTSSPILRIASVIALTHHERWDGAGYPRGLKGEEIPLEGRITAVADVFDALGSKRPYKPAYPAEECFRIMEENRGKHFDPRVLDAFFSQRDQVAQVRIEFADES